MYSRRSFLKTATIGGLAASLAGMDDLLLASGKKNREIGLITYTIQQAMKDDYKKALRRVSEIGYSFLEMGDIPGNSADEFKSFLRELGLKVLVGGSAMIDLQNKLPELIRDSRLMDHEYMICYWPWTDDGKNKTEDDFKRLADILNKIGRQCKDAGLRFAYHNHDIEFNRIKETIPYDIILSNTDPELVSMEMDLYWVFKGNQDPVKFIDKYPGRFELFHVKDMDSTPEKSFACVGDGIIDFKRIFEKSGTAGVKHFIVEHDRPENPMDCIQRSYNYLQALTY
jgi:sugar phosphate isomerase/epimerase